MIRANALKLLSIAVVFSVAQLSYAEERMDNSQGWVNNMSNEDLIAAAQAQRDDSYCPTQKALNHHWMAEHNGDEKAKVGNKALQYIAKKAFKNYWHGDQKAVQFGYKNKASKTKRAEKFSFQKLDYGLKVSGSKLKLAVEYEF